MDNAYDFDVAVSFAGEDRAIVDQVVTMLKADHYTVFYDEDYKYEMWGEDLVEYFADIYERRARFAVIFVSADYARKPWTNHERRSAIARGLEQRSAYILPVRIDDTTLPGIRSTVGYLEAENEGPVGIAEGIRTKLGNPTSNGHTRFNGQVPRTPLGATILLGERPQAWELLLFGYHLVTEMDALEIKYLDHETRFALPGESVSDDHIPDFLVAQMNRVQLLIRTFNTLLNGDALPTAAGANGEAGDPVRIRHVASRIIAIYEGLLDWATLLRSTAARSDEAVNVLNTTSDYVTQPIEAFRTFVTEFLAEANTWTDRLAAGENIRLTTVITLDIPSEVAARQNTAMDTFGRYLRSSRS